MPFQTPSAKHARKQLQRVDKCITNVKAVLSPSKSPSPQKFLTKYSNVTDYLVWDVDGRVGDMESQFKELKDMVNSSLTQKKGHDDAFELAKTRGRH